MKLTPQILPKSSFFSILIPSWNNLELLRLCVESVKIISAFSHQIIVHVNDGSDGTLEWVRSQKWPIPIRRKTYAFPDFGESVASARLKRGLPSPADA